MIARMADIVDKKTRSRMMSGIRGRDTKPELLVRKALFAAGYRYRLHSKSLLGRPDIVLPAIRCAIFVHGCFWHRHPGCRFAYTPKSNVKFWTNKFNSNVTRDKLAKVALQKAGWRVLTIWECNVNQRRLSTLVRTLDRASRH
jgi:DNA mismatch endonuclease, patch repair protein